MKTTDSLIIKLATSRYKKDLEVYRTTGVKSKFLKDVEKNVKEMGGV